MGAIVCPTMHEAKANGPEPALLESVMPESEPGESAHEAEAVTEPEAEPKLRLIIVLFQDPSGPDESRRSLITVQCVSEIKRMLRALDLPTKDELEVDLWIDSPGGDAHAAYKLMLVLRSIAGVVRVVVPDYAKSAATLIALGADEIVMAPDAELGPLDAQIAYEHEGVTISALDIARSVEHLGQTALSMVLTGGATVVQLTGISRKDTLTNMLNFVAKFMEPIVSKLDPSMIHKSNSELRVASDYAHRLLRMRNLPPADTRLLERLPEHLVENYPAHPFVISRDEAEQLGLPIIDIDDYEYTSAAQRIYDEYDRNRLTTISVFTSEDLANAAKPDDDEGGEDG